MRALTSQQQQSSLSVLPYLLVVRYVLPCVVAISTLGAILATDGGLWVTPMGVA